LIPRGGVIRRASGSLVSPASPEAGAWGLKAALIQALSRLAEGFIDSPERIVARQRVIWKHEVGVD